MAVILYLSNRLVQVIEAKGKGKNVSVQNVWQEEAPEGSIINGIITDEEVFLSWLKAFFAKNKLPKKDISLVVNSSQFNQKVLEFPVFKNAEIRKMIPREFSENRTDGTLFTYYVLDGGSAAGRQKLLATAVEKDYLLSYISFFKQAGIGISSIDSEINCLVRLFSNSPEIKKKTCLIQVLDGQEVISMVFVKGIYYYSQKNRLLNHDSFEELPEELESIRGKLFQFLTSQQVKDPIEAIYLCGDKQSELKREMPQDKVFSGEKIIVTEKAAHKKRIEFFYAAGALLGRKQGTSFYGQLKQEQKERKSRREIAGLLLPSGIVLAICLLITAIMGNTYFSGTREFHKMQKIMQENETVNASASYEMASASVETMKYKISVVEEIWAHLMSYPTINSSIEKILFDCAGDAVTVEIKSFQRDSGVLTLEAVAEDVRDINVFIENLQKQEIFEAVEYTGYTYVSGLDYYDIHVVCCMTEGAGR
ncbi:MAG: PilN domain-containing protein [Suilimivivens sp.]